MPDSAIHQVYVTAPDEASLEADLLDQGLAEENDDGEVVPTIGVTMWTPRDGETTVDGETEYTYADYVLAVIGWTPHSREHVGVSDDKMDALLGAGTLANGTEVRPTIADLGLHDSEPRYTTYGVDPHGHSTP